MAPSPFPPFDIRAYSALILNGVLIRKKSSPIGEINEAVLQSDMLQLSL